MLPIPTTAWDIRSINRIFRAIRQKAADGTVAPIVRRLPANTSNSSTIIGGAGTFFDINRILSREIMRAGNVVHLIASGMHTAPTNGTPATSFRLQVAFLGDYVLRFPTRSLAGSSASDLSWFLDGYIGIKSTGASGSVNGFGTMFVEDTNGDFLTLLYDNTTSTGVAVNTNSDEQLEISVTHGRSDQTAILRDFVVEVQR